MGSIKLGRMKPEEVKRKSGAVANREIEIKDDRCERCTETDGENAFESDWRGDFETRETDKKWDAVAKKKLALKRKQWKEQSEQQQNKKERFFGEEKTTSIISSIQFGRGGKGRRR